MCLRMNSPATSRVGNGGCPGPTRHTELKRPARKPQSISPASRTSGWRRLMISSRSGRNRSSWRSSRGWLARKPACTPGFLAKSITCSGQIIAIDHSLQNSSRTTATCRPSRNWPTASTASRRRCSSTAAPTANQSPRSSQDPHRAHLSAAFGAGALQGRLWRPRTRGVSRSAMLSISCTGVAWHGMLLILVAQASFAAG